MRPSIGESWIVPQASCGIAGSTPAILCSMNSGSASTPGATGLASNIEGTQVALELARHACTVGDEVVLAGFDAQVPIQVAVLRLQMRHQFQEHVRQFGIEMLAAQ